jgi:rhomboid protease GluP
MLGKVKYITAYLCTGIFASLASLWWHKEPIASAGASGAIFGMFGVFLALLSTNLIPKQARNSLLQSIAIFVVYNLAYGMKSGVDNSAHVGGLLSGLLIGYLYYPGLRSGTKKSMAVAGVLIVLTVAAAGFYLQSNETSVEKRNRVNAEIENSKYSGTDKFQEQLNEIVAIEKMAIAPFNDSLTDKQLAEKLQTVSLPGWEKADEIAKNMETLEISEKLKQKAVKLQEYIAMRKAEIDAISQLASKEDSASMLLLSNTREKIDQIAVELGKP